MILRRVIGQVEELLHGGSVFGCLIIGQVEEPLHGGSVFGCLIFGCLIFWRLGFAVGRAFGHFWKRSGRPVGDFLHLDPRFLARGGT